MSFSSEIIDSLFKDLGYKGQLYKTKKSVYAPPEHKYSSTDDVLLSKFINYIDESDFRLYKHQYKIVEALLSKQDIVVSLVKGVGTRTIIDVGSIFSSLFSAKNILYIHSDKDYIKERLNRNKDKLLGSTLVTYSDKSFEIANIKYLTADELTNALINKELDTFLCIDIIIIEDIQNYTFYERQHLKNIISLLKKIKPISSSDQKIQIVLTATPINNIQEVAEYYNLKEPVYVNFDNAPEVNYNFVFWLPTLIPKEYDRINKSFKIERTSFRDDIQLLINILNKIRVKCKILFLQNDFTLGESEKKQFLSIRTNQDVFFATDFTKIELSSFDIIISLSVPYLNKIFLTQIGKFIKKEGLLIILLGEDHISTQLLKSNDFSITNSEELLPNIYLGNLQSINDSYNKLTESILDVIHLKLNPKNDELNYLKFGYTSDNNILVVSGNENLKYPVSFQEAKCRYQDGTIHYLYGQYYKVNITDNEMIKLVAEDDSVVVNYPMITIKDIKNETLKNSEVLSSNKTEFKKDIIECDIDLLILGYFTAKSHSFESNIVKVERNELIELKSWPCLILVPSQLESKISLTNWKAILIKYFSFILKDLSRKIIIIDKKDKIYILPLYNDPNLVNHLYQETDYILKEFFLSYILDLFQNCICNNGCSLCLYEFELATERKSYSKSGIFEWLSEFNGIRDEISQTIKARTDKITKTKFINYFDFWNKRIKKLLEVRFRMKIQDLAQVIYAEISPKNIFGQYNEDKNIITINSMLDFKENELVDLLAHEMAHNWQNENMNIKFKDKTNSQSLYFVEGFAQWLEFKVLDFYGIIDEMEEIKLRGIDVPTDSDVYGLGFLLFNEIEEKYGFINVFNVITQGCVIMKDDKIESDKLLNDIIGNYI